MTTEDRRNGGKIFYGWWIIVVSAVGLLFCSGPVLGYTFGVFFKSLSNEFKWGRAEISLGFSLSLIAMTLAFPLIGRLIDRFGARQVILPSVLIFGLGLMSFYFLTAHIWHFYAIYLVLGVVGGATATPPYFRVISHWFDKRRGLALGLVMVGYGLGALIVPALSHAFIVTVGWRVAYFLIGLLVIVVIIPVVSFFLIEKPQMMGLLPDGRTVAQQETGKHTNPDLGLSFREALHTGTFWLVVCAVFLIAVSALGSLIHLVPMLTDRGVSAKSAALATSVTGGAVTLGRISAGYLLDRYFVSYVAACFFCGAGLGLFLLWTGVTGGLIFVAAFLVGLGNGAEGEVLAYLVGRYFGLRAFGVIYASALSAFTLGGVVGPFLMGFSFDFTGSYSLVMGIFVLATLTAAGLMTRLGPYRVWEPVPVAAVVSPT